MNAATRIELISGPAGAIEVAIDLPSLDVPTLEANGNNTPPTLRGLACIAHPHPLFGGTMDNKVVQTLARALVQLGYACVRPNFRGVGRSAGVHDAGIAEREDLLAVFEHFRALYPSGHVVLAGFSFGSYVQTHVAQRLADRGIDIARLILVGTATSRWEVAPVREDTLVIHGEQDDTVPLSSVLDWARPQALPVVVVPGADHFFHRKLPILKRLVLQALSPSF